jgi:hypothetical protein
MINVSDLAGAGAVLCTFSNLNGNQDVLYEVILDIIIGGSPGVNLYCFVQPNGTYTGMQRWAENRSYTSDGVTFTNDAQGTNVCPAWGFPCGHTDWNVGGRLHSETRISALAINPPQAMGRSSNHAGSWVPAGQSGYTMNWRGGVTWWDGSTNITYMRIGCWNSSGGGVSGVSVVGRASLKVVN